MSKWMPLSSPLFWSPVGEKKIIAQVSAFSEHERISKERRQIKDKLRRLAKAYIDGIVEQGGYNVQRKLLQNALDSLVVPEVDAALNAGQLLEPLELVWEKATLEEKHHLLAAMLDAVYVDRLPVALLSAFSRNQPFTPCLNPLPGTARPKS